MIIRCINNERNPATNDDDNHDASSTAAGSTTACYIPNANINDRATISCIPNAATHISYATDATNASNADISIHTWPATTSVSPIRYERLW